MIKELAHFHRVSGTFYYIPDEYNLLETKGVTNMPLSPWEKEAPDDGGIYYKLTCENHPGLELKREIILGECSIKFKGCVGNEIEVAV